MDNVNDTIQNGVKRTFPIQSEMESEVKEIVQMHQHRKPMVDDVIQYGMKDIIENTVKEILPLEMEQSLSIEDAIQNGVKDTKPIKENLKIGVERAVEYGKKKSFKLRYPSKDGVKDVFGTIFPETEGEVTYTIQNGVKVIDTHNQELEHTVNDIIETGQKENVKEIKHGLLGHINDEQTLATSMEFSDKIDDTIENGVRTISGRRFDRRGKVDEILENGDKL
jgi:hypothetical protein